MAVIHVPMSEATEVVQSLLKAAQELGLDPTTTVKTSTDGVFGFSLIVPDEVEHRAMHGNKPSAAEEPEPEPKPAKKVAKKAARKAEPVLEEEE